MSMKGTIDNIISTDASLDYDVPDRDLPMPLNGPRRCFINLSERRLRLTSVTFDAGKGYRDVAMVRETGKGCPD